MSRLTSGIDLASGTGTTVLVATTASQRFKGTVTLVPDSTGEWELVSGASTILAHVQVGVAGGQYIFDVESAAVGDDLSLVRVGTLAMGGAYDVRVTP